VSCPEASKGLSHREKATKSYCGTQHNFGHRQLWKETMTWKGTCVEPHTLQTPWAWQQSLRRDPTAAATLGPELRPKNTNTPWASTSPKPHLTSQVKQMPIRVLCPLYHMVPYTVSHLPLAYIFHSCFSGTCLMSREGRGGLRDRGTSLPSLSWRLCTAVSIIAHE